MSTKVERNQTRNKDTMFSTWIGAFGDVLLYVPRLVVSFFRNGL